MLVLQSEGVRDMETQRGEYGEVKKRNRNPRRNGKRVNRRRGIDRQTDRQ